MFNLMNVAAPSAWAAWCHGPTGRLRCRCQSRVSPISNAITAALIERSATLRLPEVSVGLIQSTTPPRSGPGARSRRSSRLPIPPPSSRPRATATLVVGTDQAATVINANGDQAQHRDEHRVPLKSVARAGEVAVELEMEESTHDIDHAAAGQKVGRDCLCGNVERHDHPGYRGEEPPLGVPGPRAPG